MQVHLYRYDMGALVFCNDDAENGHGYLFVFIWWREYLSFILESEKYEGERGVNIEKNKKSNTGGVHINFTFTIHNE